MKIFASARLAVAVGCLAAVTGASVVDRSVHRKLASSPTVDLLVRMKPAYNVVERHHEAVTDDRGARITALKKELSTVHAEALEPLANLFVKESTPDVEVQTFWIAPLASIKGATIELVEKIASLPGVESVREARAYPLPQSKKIQTQNQSRKLKEMWFQNDAGTAWGVWKINAPAVWDMGNTGQGVRVGAVDSGVNIDHEALKRNFGGDYSWFDPELKTAIPHDDAGHGSHTMGTIAGNYDIGVAPGASWVSCRGCRTVDCPEIDLLACAQFMLCPTKPDGSAPDCSKAPRVINNSWSGYPGDPFYIDAIAAWVKAGIIPVFAQGNEGLCATANSPGDFPDVIGVGATTPSDGLASFSSKGPSVDGRVKPDLTAPGQSIMSSYDALDDYYAVDSGTSYAAPHVTGAIALLLHAEPNLTLAQVRQRLISTTVQQTLLPATETCGNTTNDMWPNNMYGHGRLDVYSAIKGVRTLTPKMPKAPTQAPLDKFVTPPPTRF